jgi:hypothetical protein
MSTQASSRSKFHFRLSELLIATALVAVASAWPLALIFVVPLIVTRVFKRMGYGGYAPVLSMIGLSLVLGALFSFSYWHYPFGQPSTLAELRTISAVDQLSEISGLNSAGPSNPPATIVKLPPANALYWNQRGELDAADRLIAEFANRTVMIRSTEPISSQVLTSIWKAANRAGLLIDGESGYPDTKSLRGYVGIARSGDGGRFAFATLMGGQQSNDHYPYYEFVVPLDREDVTVANSQWFYVDISGLEGMTWLGLSVIAFVLMLPVTLLLQLWSVSWQRRTERRLQAAGGQAARDAGNKELQVR